MATKEAVFSGLDYCFMIFALALTGWGVYMVGRFIKGIVHGASRRLGDTTKQDNSNSDSNSTS